jgi:phosphatidylglycerophosphate synthase
MSHATSLPLGPNPRRLLAATVGAVAAGAAFLSAGAAAIAAQAEFGWSFATAALWLYLAGGVTLVARIRPFHPFDRFGPANAVTLVRLMLASLFAGLALEMTVASVPPQAGILWLFVFLAAGALLLDGLDGALARRTGIASAFGARFDMEVDALLILLLSVLAWLLDKAGPWVLLSGALRYLFVAAGMVWPVLMRPLPPSWRRKTISVIQGGSLTLVLAPAVQCPLTCILAGGALALLVYSFAVDVFRQVADARIADPRRP